MKGNFSDKSTFFRSKRPPGRRLLHGVISVLISTVFLFALPGCGGSDNVASGENGGGEIIGTGFTGTAATGTAIANSVIRVKSLSGQILTSSTGADGTFSTSKLFEASANTPRGPYLLRVEQGNNNYLYSVATAASATALDADSVQINVNIHPYSDLLIRNWFALHGEDIDSAFSNDNPLDDMPSQIEIDALSTELTGILRHALSERGVAENFNLLGSVFAANGQGFDALLDDSRVVINNNVVNVIVSQENLLEGVQAALIENASLAFDFTSDNDQPPSTPQDLRALVGSSDGETVLVWTPSSDDKGVAGYQVYRNDTLIGSSPYPVFIDVGLQPATPYEYKVEAVDGRGQLSARSSAAIITLSGPDTTAPPAIEDLVVEEVAGVIELSWAHPNVSDVAGFQVLRGAPSNANTEVANVTATGYRDFDTISSYSPCYRVVAYDAAGNESPASGEVCLDGGNGPDPTEDATLAFSAASYHVAESQSSAVIRVQRSGDLTEAVSVQYAVTAQTATAGVDFAETSGTLDWVALDDEPKTFSIQIFNNPEAESDETVNLILSNPVNAELGNQASAQLTIADAPAVSCVELVPTTITTNTTLSQPCYNVNSSVTVSNAATLTINPGVKLVFAQGRSLDVDSDGVLKAIGTEQHPITFTGELPSPGYWDGIRIDSVVTSELDYVTVEYGGADGFTEASVGVAFDGRLSVAHALIRHGSGYGVTVSASSARLTRFENNTVTLNEQPPIYLPANNIGVIAGNNVLSGNVTDVGGDRDYIFLFEDSDVTSDQTWSVTDVPYRVTHTDILAQLTVVPGANLEFTDGGRFDVRDGGTLIADGSEEKPILFTGVQKSSGYWTGLQIYNNTANLLNHVVIEYGGGSGGNTDGNIGVFFSGGRLTVQNTVLRHSASYGFDFDDNINLVFENVTSTNNNRPGKLDIDDVHLLGADSTYGGNSDDRIVLTGSGISTSQTVPNLGVPLFATTLSTIAVQADLGFEPGVELQFAPSGGFNVGRNGSLAIVGTAAKPVILTGAEKSKGYWNGIQYTFSNGAGNRIDHAVIEYGGAASGNTEALVGYFGQESRGSVTNTVLRGSVTNGIEVDGSVQGVISFSGNTFEDIDGEDVLDHR